VLLEPVTRERGNALERTRLLEQVARPRHDLEPRLASERGPRLPIPLGQQLPGDARTWP
jgi:hypothetical protein